MSSLYIERLLDFGVRRKKKMDEDDGGDEQGEKRICLLDQLVIFRLTGHV